ncbi:hypothetical protein Tcan_17746, partial [Toxocara canis]
SARITRWYEQLRRLKRSSQSRASRFSGTALKRRHAVRASAAITTAVGLTPITTNLASVHRAESESSNSAQVEPPAGDLHRLQEHQQQQSNGCGQQLPEPPTRGAYELRKEQQR